MTLMRLALAAVALVIAVGSGRADDAVPSEGEKMMSAAAIILAIRSGLPGEVRTSSETEARRIGGTAVFRKVSDCIYRVDFRNGLETGLFTQINFHQLTGAWHSQADQMIFSGSAPNTMCYDFGSSGKGCSDVAWFPYAGDHQRLLDDMAYVLNHGCHATAPDPY